MAYLQIDQTKCKQDGFCAAECPMGIITFAGKGHFPEMSLDNSAICIQCGHCVAVCPHGALDHPAVPLAASPKIEKKLAVTPEQAIQFLRSRRSVRQFAEQPVEKTEIEKLIATARFAPTGGNTQLVEWLVIDNQQVLKEISAQVIEWMRLLLQNPKATVAPYYPALVQAWDVGKDSVLRGAPCLIVAMAEGTVPIRMIDVTIALSYLDLAAPLYGLGTCWAGLLQGAMLADPALKKLVGIPEDIPFHYPMMLGHPKARYYRLPERRAAKIHWQ